nr:transposase (putative), gypsy type [Tanacetum cinerariifolium]
MGRDTVQLETAVNTISHEYLLEFTSEYGIPETLHPALPGPEDRVVDFLEGKIGVYTMFFEFANFRFPLSQFLFDVLGYYQIHLSQLSVIGAAKVSHFEINCRVLNIIPTLGLFRVFYTPSFNSGWMSFSKRPGKNTPQCYTKPLDSLKNWNNRFLWVDESVFSTVVDWRTNAPKDGMPATGTYFVEAVRALDTHRTPIQKQPEMLLCLVWLSRRYYLGDEVYPTFLHDNDREMDLFSLIHAPNPTKVKVGSCPRAPYEVPLLTLTANRVIEMDDPATGTAASEVPPFGNVPAAVAPEPNHVGVAAADPPAATESRKRGRDGTDTNAPPNHCEEIMLILSPPEALMGERASLPYSWVWLLLLPCLKMCLQASVTQIPCVLLILRPALRPMWLKWGVTNSSLLDTPEACQDLVDHVTPPGYFSELRHMRNKDFLGEYNVNLARQVALGSQLRLRFEQEAKLMRKSVAQVARRDKRIEARELEIKNLEALLETEANMKRAAEDKSDGLIKELEDMRARFSDLQVSHEHLSQQVASLKEQVSGEEKLNAAFEEFKRYEDERVEQRCAKLDARLDALSIDFDEELYPHMLTAIAGRRWVVGHGLRLAMMKCAESLEMRQAFADVVSAGVAKGMSEGLKHGVEHGQAQLTVESIKAYDPEAEAKFVAALQSLKDLKYPLLDQLEGLKDAPMDVIMAALYLESDTRGGDAPQYIRDLRPSSSQLTIPVYPEVRDPRNPWAYKEEIKLSDAIAANISRAQKKKKCRIVCRTHGVGSAHHARSDGVPVSVPTVVPHGLALLLVDTATQNDLEDT